VTATATSKPRRRVTLIVAAATILLAVIVGAVVASMGSSENRTAGTRGPGGARTASAFSWLRPGPAPAGWQQVTTPTSEATLSYPPGWMPIPGDRGTVTRSLRDASGRYLGYLNVTPRQGDERLHGWAAFRAGHNVEEGDRQVRLIAAADGVRFRGARGSCVIDDYVSKVAGNHYREIACLVSGHRHTDVFIAAGLKRDWPAVGSSLERATSAFLQR
jgi:hypothetical protein